MKINMKEELIKRNLPGILKLDSGRAVKSVMDWELRREQIEENLLDNLWGHAPEWQGELSYEIISEELVYNAKALKAKIELTIDINKGSFSFPFLLYLPSEAENTPAFIHIRFNNEDNNEDDVSNYIIDNGFAYASFYYRDIVDDMVPDKENGIGALPQKFDDKSWGKVHMWAWGAMKIMDYLEGLIQIDSSRVAVVGHSRLGKAALCAGALDQRFSMTISNCSGGGGIAIFRGKNGERIKNLSGSGSGTWLCKEFTKYAGREDALPYDHHFTGALIAPRHLYVASATKDEWADPLSELLSAYAASAAYEPYKLKGLVIDENIELTPMVRHAGHIGYHLREGEHYMGIYDWKQFIKYRLLHNC